MDLLDVLEVIAALIKISIGIILLVLFFLITGSMVSTITEPSNGQAQCTSIEGAKWSGENCYKNGIKINFSEDNLL